ncbi:MAG: glycosyltransferase [Acidobacteria bacterium]|nr:glycosyltransferase [Acidobacteriota bacterium]MCW5948018.1 glycosyltransferase [Pyrinomonadaceae bacterium]
MPPISTLIQKAIAVVSTEGIGGIRGRLVSSSRRRRENRLYRRWIRDRERVATQQDADALGSGPLISILLPVYDVEPQYLRSCIDSVIGQRYRNWELCIADDRSTRKDIAPLLGAYEAADDRVKVIFREENGHISAASNTALEMASGEFCVLLDHDDLLAADALYWVARTLNKHPEAGLIFSDEDLIDGSGRRFAPKFKPDLSRDLMLSLNQVTHLSAFRTELIRDVGGFRIGYEGSQDHDLSLRILERLDDDKVIHIPRVLYHWRVLPSSVASDLNAKPYALDNARRAIADHLERTSRAATVEAAYGGLHRVRYSASGDEPTFALIHSDRGPAELNDAAAAAKGEVLVFLDPSLRKNLPDAIRELVLIAAAPGVGAAGGKIVDGKGRTVGGALFAGVDGAAAIAHYGYYRHEPGNMFRNRLIGNFSAVSIRSMAIRRDVFLSVGGFDAETFSTGLFDVDLCLRLGERGLRIVHDPHAEFSGEDLGRMISSTDDSIRAFEKRWGRFKYKDPFYNPAFDRSGRLDIDPTPRS